MFTVDTTAKLGGVARSVTSPLASRDDCARLESFAASTGVALEDLLPPEPAARHVVSTTIDVEGLRALDAYARDRGTTAAVILRGLVLGLVRPPRTAHNGAE